MSLCLRNMSEENAPDVSNFSPEAQIIWTHLMRRRGYLTGTHSAESSRDNGHKSPANNAIESCNSDSQHGYEFNESSALGCELASPSSYSKNNQSFRSYPIDINRMNFDANNCEFNELISDNVSFKSSPNILYRTVGSNEIANRAIFVESGRYQQKHVDEERPTKRSRNDIDLNWTDPASTRCPSNQISYSAKDKSNTTCSSGRNSMESFARQSSYNSDHRDFSTERRAGIILNGNKNNSRNYFERKSGDCIESDNESMVSFVSETQQSNFSVIPCSIDEKHRKDRSYSFNTSGEPLFSLTGESNDNLTIKQNSNLENKIQNVLIDRNCGTSSRQNKHILKNQNARQMSSCSGIASRISAWSSSCNMDSSGIINQAQIPQKISSTVLSTVNAQPVSDKSTSHPVTLNDPWISGKNSVDTRPAVWSSVELHKNTERHVMDVGLERSCHKQHQMEPVEQKRKEFVGASTAGKSENITSYNVAGKNRQTNIITLSRIKQEQLMDRLCDSGDLLLTLIFSDHSTLMSRNRKIKAGKENEELNVISLLVHLRGRNSRDIKCRESELLFVDFPYVSNKSQEFDFVKTCILRIMTERKSKKICFGAQDLMKSVIKHFSYDERLVMSDWLVYDVKIASWLLNSDYSATSLEDALKLYPDLSQPSWVLHNGDHVTDDLQLLWQLFSRQSEQLKLSQQWRLFVDLECSLCPLLAVMELSSISVDVTLMKKSCSTLKSQLDSTESKIYKAAGFKFSINSHAQLREILFTDLRLDDQCPDTKLALTSVSKLKSTSERVLRKMKDLHPLPGLVLQYRQYQKLKSTYVDGLMAYVTGGELRTHWDHTAAATGRLTSTSPNLQSIPKLSVVVSQSKEATQVTTEDGEVKYMEVFAREPFVSKKGWSFLAADFQQIELRILAHLSNDSRLLELFNNNNCNKNDNNNNSNSGSSDVFTQLTSQWLNKSVDAVMTSEREQTKRVVYSVMYGVGKERLAEYLETTTEDAKNIMQSFLVSYPGINVFRRKCIEEAKKKGYNCTLFGRRRLYPNINHSDFHIRSGAERQAVNFCMQGTSADICKAAMIQVKRVLASETDVNAKLLLQIHDELLLEVENKHIDRVADLLRRIMESQKCIFEDFGTTPMRVPLKISLSVGTNWGHMQNY